MFFFGFRNDFCFFCELKRCFFFFCVGWLFVSSCLYGIKILVFIGVKLILIEDKIVFFDID